MVEQNPSMIDATLERLRAAQADIRDEYLAANNDPWIIGYSGGKDSTLLTQLVFEMLLDLAPSDRKRPVHVLCNDTLVESPVLMAYIDKMLARLQTAAENLHLPIVVVKTSPDPDQTFWVNLIGRGYPAPTRMFRWCTDRMKIADLELHPYQDLRERRGCFASRRPQWRVRQPRSHHQPPSKSRWFPSQRAR